MRAGISGPYGLRRLRDATAARLIRTVVVKKHDATDGDQLTLKVRLLRPSSLGLRLRPFEIAKSSGQGR